MPITLEKFRTVRLSRGIYAASGVALAVAKYNLDRLISSRFDQPPFFPWNYFIPAGDNTLTEIAGRNLPYFTTLAWTAVPFAILGVMLTFWRLRSAGWPALLVVLFFVPVLNLLFFAMLCASPPADRMPESGRGLARWLRWILPRGKLAAAAVSLVITSVITTGLVLLSVERLASYGWGVFYAVPFVAGFIAVGLGSVHEPLSYRRCMTAAALPIVIAGALLFALASEGLICLLMAAPIGLFMSFLGGTVGYLVQSQIWRWNQSSSAMCSVLAILPVIFVADTQSEAPLRSCVTEVQIAAPPEVVWEHVVQFSRIPAPDEWVFKTGISYPIESVIDGKGVGSVRYCRFSTGDFVEPITVWDPPRRLAFTVESQPEPMQELSPYRHVHPPHLEGNFMSERGEFLLITQADGGTLLRGTTWYRQRLWPQAYWHVFSDYLIHAIHRRVLIHIREEAQAGGF